MMDVGCGHSQGLCTGTTILLSQVVITDSNVDGITGSNNARKIKKIRSVWLVVLLSIWCGTLVVFRKCWIMRRKLLECMRFVVCDKNEVEKLLCVCFFVIWFSFCLKFFLNKSGIVFLNCHHQVLFLSSQNFFPIYRWGKVTVTEMKLAKGPKWWLLLSWK